MMWKLTPEPEEEEELPRKPDPDLVSWEERDEGDEDTETR
jgi:hypothetical protein